MAMRARQFKSDAVWCIAAGALSEPDFLAIVTAEPAGHKPTAQP
jgi:hypothetical protein